MYLADSVRMCKYFAAWVSLGMLSSLLQPAGAIECSEQETLLRPLPRPMPQLSECLMECTGMTYIKKLQLQDSRAIQLKDSTEGDLGEYCWSTELGCTVGETFQHAFVVLPVDASSTGHETLEVKTTVPPGVALRPHVAPSTVADSCGLRYEVTRHFDAEDAGPSFCVRVVARDDALGDRVLRCPPFLVTFWQRNRRPSNP